MTVVNSADERTERAGSRPSLDDLRRKSVEARKLIVQAIHHAGAGHLGGPLSATDILVALYFDQMNVDPSNPDWPQRDRFILSKGHSSIALYTVLAMRGYFPVEELQHLRRGALALAGPPGHARPAGAGDVDRVARSGALAGRRAWRWGRRCVATPSTPG